MMEDAQLLRRFAENRSEDAFAELVRRHLNLVYSAALRQVGGDPHLARDASQQVFDALARRASSLTRHPALTGWLYTTAHFSAAKIMRTECRRRAREQKAHAMHELLSSSAPEPSWERLRPLLDTAMHELSKPDRTAILLRFFEGRSFGDLGTILGVSDNTARMRVDRALEKLRTVLAGRGVTSTTAALSALLATQTVMAAPAGFAASITSLAVAGAASGGTAATFLQFMSLPKILTGVASAVLMAGTIGVVAQQSTIDQLQDDIAVFRSENQNIWRLRAQNIALLRTDEEAQKLRAETAGLGRLRDEMDAARNRMASSARSPGAPVALPHPPGVYDYAKVEVKPQLPRRMAGFVYPLILRLDYPPTQVVLDFVVDEQGDVRDARVVSTAEPELGEAVLAVVRRWKAVPGTIAGQPVSTQIRGWVINVPGFAPSQSQEQK